MSCNVASEDLRFIAAVDGKASRESIEALLNSYLAWAAGLDLQTRIDDLARLPVCCKEWACRVNEESATWVAWNTDLGLVTATGRYDHEQSQLSGYWVLLIDWGLPPLSRNMSWWRSDPRRPREWTAGRGRPP